MTSSAIKHAYTDAAVADAYDGERFDNVIGRTFDRLEKRALARIVGRVTREVPSPAVLDVPCGTGRITEWLLARGFDVTGGDISPEMLRVARAKCDRFGAQASWRPMDLDRLDVEDETYDLVTCIRLFHHLDTVERRPILRELARVTRRFVVVNVSFSSPVYRLRRRVKRALRQGISRQSSTESEIAAEAAAAGLRLEARSFVWPLVSEDLVLLMRKTHDAAV
jgi:ubiquinone/menaquinone biosynthesis C-methylase UbiE